MEGKGEVEARVQIIALGVMVEKAAMVALEVTGVAEEL